MLPESGGALHPLATYKGVAIRIGGRPLVAWLVERLLASKGFGPVTIAGPAHVYEPLGLPARLLDTDASVAQNLRVAIEAREAGPLAVISCDVLPSVAELAELRARYEEARPCALWFPLARVPKDTRELGAFAWKPEYSVVLDSGESVHILPGHLGILEPASLRLALVYRLFDAAYRTRNRSLAYRRGVMLRTVLFSPRSPGRTWKIVGSGLRLRARRRLPALPAARGAAAPLRARAADRAHLPLRGRERHPLSAARHDQPGRGHRHGGRGARDPRRGRAGRRHLSHQSQRW